MKQGQAMWKLLLVSSLWVTACDTKVADDDDDNDDNNSAIGTSDGSPFGPSGGGMGGATGVGGSSGVGGTGGDGTGGGGSASSESGGGGTAATGPGDGAGEGSDTDGESSGSGDDGPADTGGPVVDEDDPDTDEGDADDGGDIDSGSTSTSDTGAMDLSEYGLVIEIVWENAGDDMDLHLISPTGLEDADGDGKADGIETEADCYFSNCTADGFYGGLDWGVPGDPSDDPTLVADDITETGPEIITIQEPQDGEYKAIVHDYPSSVYTAGNAVTMSIYIDGDLEWTDTRLIVDEDSYTEFALINTTLGSVTAL